MSELYLKRGESVRLTLARGIRTLTSSLERGAAGVREGRFFSASLEPDLPWTLPVEPAEAIEDRLRAALPRGLRLERLEILLGTSHHVLGQKQWSEAHSRIFVACLDTSRGARIELLRGGATPAELDLAGIEASLRAWSRQTRNSRGATDTEVELQPPVTAAVASFFASSDPIPATVPLMQEPHPSFPLDGNGAPVARFEAAGTTRRDWPNSERPSYRTPPRASLLHVRIEAAGAAEAPAGAIVLEPLGAVRRSREGIELPALVGDENGSFAARLAIPLGALASGRRSSGAIRWFPIGGGAWGDALVVSGVSVRPLS